MNTPIVARWYQDVSEDKYEEVLVLEFVCSKCEILKAIFLKQDGSISYSPVCYLRFNYDGIKRNCK